VEREPSEPRDASDLESVVSPRSGRVRWALALILGAAGLLRLLNFPSQQALRDCDEIAYLTGGLALWEGMAPGLKHTPAGPQTWVGWLFAAALSAHDLVVADPEQCGESWKTRPFLAVDSALFALYANPVPLRQFMLALQFLIALAGVYAAFRLGYQRGGLGTALVIGGLVATLPLFVEFAGMTRPYSDAWSFVLLALATAAAESGRRRWLGSGIFLGLAVASRIEMLAAAPLVLWEFWNRPEPGAFRASLVRLGTTALLVTLLTAPWLLSSLVGNLRNIASVRVAGQFHSDAPRLDTLRDLVVGQGLGIFLVVLVIGLVTIQWAPTARWRPLAVYLGLLVLSMFVGPYQPMRYHAVVILALLSCGALATAAVLRRWLRLTAPLIALVLLVPGARSVLLVQQNRAQGVPDEAVRWLEERVPAGTVVYLSPAFELCPPLPTAAAADRIWREVTDDNAWRLKFGRGLSRFGLATDHMPRALSEENLVMERSNARRWFILGGQAGEARPRYDVRLYCFSPTFGVQYLAEEFARTGGVLIWRRQAPLAQLGQPVAQWGDPEHGGTAVFCSNDVRARLHRP
jgi:hypothetical protein